MRHLCNGMLHPDLFPELQIPLCIDDAKHLHFGLGLSSAAKTASAAYIGSISAAAPIAQIFLILEGIVEKGGETTACDSNDDGGDATNSNSDLNTGADLERGIYHVHENDKDGIDGDGVPVKTLNTRQGYASRLLACDNVFAKSAMRIVRSITEKHEVTKVDTPTLKEVSKAPRVWSQRKLTSLTHRAQIQDITRNTHTQLRKRTVSECTDGAHTIRHSQIHSHTKTRQG